MTQPIDSCEATPSQGQAPRRITRAHDDERRAVVTMDALLAPVFAGLSEAEARLVHDALDQYVENLADAIDDPDSSPEFVLARGVLDRCTAAFCALADAAPGPAPTPARKTPSMVSAAATARVISRVLRKAGFLMSDTSDRHQWTEGFHVSRVGCGKSLSVSYSLRNWSLHSSGDRSKMREEMARATAFLREQGYPLDERGWLECLES